VRLAKNLVLLGLILAIAARPASAELTERGVDTNRPFTPIVPDHLANQCFMLWFGPESPSEISRLQALGFNITQTINPADITTANLANYRVLVINLTGPGVLDPAQPSIQNFVSAGGGLLIHQPNALGLTDYTPTGFDVVITSPFWCNFDANALGHIVDGSHPITAGLLDSDLSGAFDLVGSLGPGFQVLARSLDCGDPALAAGTLGSGRVAFEDGNASPQAQYPGSNSYWGNLLSWLCSAGPTPTRGSTWGSVKAIYR